MAKFDIDADQISGVAIIALTDRLTAPCLLPSAIDSYVADLKQELDAVAAKAKDTILSMRNLLDFSEGPN